MDAPNMQQGKVCKCPHHKMMPILVILFGLVFLLGNMGVLSWALVGLVWPVLVIAAGGMKLAKGMCKCC